MDKQATDGEAEIVSESGEMEGFYQPSPSLSGEALCAAVEALIFANGEPLELSQIVSLTRSSSDEVLAALKSIADRFAGLESGLVLARIGSAYQFRTKPACAPVLRLLRQERPRRLSAAALETLSIIAYRQPIVKSDIEQIRGVDATPTIKTLLDRGLIKIIGHQATVGQPALYATSDDFLKIFGLQSLKDLPTLRELTEVERDPGESGADVQSDLGPVLGTEASLETENGVRV